MSTIKNPILKGFNPDPSICRVGDDYYIATSTFEWFPGVQIHHSKDLVNWELVAHPLSRVSQLDMTGCGDSCGIWAPNLTHDGEKFYLVYTNVKRQLSPFKDAYNYIVTADTVEGEWSEPTFINASGFDPTLFHDDDGRKYFLNVWWDHRIESDQPERNKFHSIIMQELDAITLEKLGEPKSIHYGTEIGLQEGPNIYKRNGYYYLLLAEGGTIYEHAASIARSNDLFGPYENCPDTPFISSYFDPTNPLQKAGHGSMCAYDHDTWYFVHLCGRPIPTNDSVYRSERGYCPLGRETAIQQVEWINDWPYIVGGTSPSMNVQSPYDVVNTNDDPIIQYVDLTKEKFNLDFQTTRSPINPNQTFYTEAGLNLIGKESLSSLYNKNIIGRRWQSLHHESNTELTFLPKSFQQSAGLVNFYNSDNYIACGITCDDQIGLCLEVFAMDAGQYKSYMKKAISCSENIKLRSVVNFDRFNFEADLGDGFELICGDLESAKISDDYIKMQQDAFFTGAFVALYCYDLHGQSETAVFKTFSYVEK